ncbi:trans-2-enoyl-CoA reductase family protein [Vibrio sp. Of7-15]|uniref:enoyl-ACP reductase FabV n=1 Tax=Vibrio sp. Of7-15 TaxID=2724879 RepID=UPI001EF2D86D|nr:enoyl-ACP reductase FabV [Vibrio sp. Of7-15]MCG7496250.1 trans-2-enoyl-CoA reductase family protein [Vibrio sp. Of7-15]
MIIKPVISGVVARSAHPFGCEAAVLEQIEFIKKAKPMTDGPKRVLILGASSGFGLASRIALAFGGNKTHTIGVSFERGPSEKSVGTAGWYNNIFFKQQADKAGIKSKNIIGDAFSPAVRQQVIDYINEECDGKLDLIIYSLATGVRPNPDTGEMWRSSIKTIGESVTGSTLNLELDQLDETTVSAANEQEIEDTIKVMGGEDWESWIDDLINADVLNEGCRTIAYSYIGPEATYPIYHQGTLGRAKINLHQTSHALNLKLAGIGGSAYACVCKALVTKASVFIPGFSTYILSLFKVMKAKGLHEGCIEQMHRLFADILYSSPSQIPVDGERLIRIDDRELREDVQQEVSKLMASITPDNFAQLGDYEGYKKDFLKLNGFGFSHIDYNTDVDLNALEQLHF